MIEWAIANPVVCQAPAEPKPSEVIEPLSESTKGSAKKRPAKALYVPKALRNNTVGNAKSSSVIQTQNPVPVIKTWKDEIESQTGPVQVVSPLTDYLALESAGCLTTRDKAFRRVVELGDFPKGDNQSFHSVEISRFFRRSDIT